MRKEKHVVLYSGGASSSYVAKWVVDKYGKDNTILFHTDTLWEDEDNVRFMEECAAYLGMDITKRIDGRTPEDVFFEQRFLGNARFAKCSEELKVKQTLLFIDELREKGYEPILYFGIGPHEKQRADRLVYHYEHLPTEPVRCQFPMIDAIDKDIKAKEIIKKEWGITLPRMYELGFSHANCSGRCVRGGLNHYAKLYLIWPHKYQEQEDMERRFNKEFNLNVSILKRDGKPYTLETYRKDVLEKMTKEALEDYCEENKDEIPIAFCSFS